MEWGCSRRVEKRNKFTTPRPNEAVLNGEPLFSSCDLSRGHNGRRPCTAKERKRPSAFYPKIILTQKGSEQLASILLAKYFNPRKRSLSSIYFSFETLNFIKNIVEHFILNAIKTAASYRSSFFLLFLIHFQFYKTAQLRLRILNTAELKFSEKRESF